MTSYLQKKSLDPGGTIHETTLSLGYIVSNIRLTLPPINMEVQKKVTPIAVTFQIRPISTEPWLWEKEYMNIMSHCFSGAGIIWACNDSWTWMHVFSMEDLLSLKLFAPEEHLQTPKKEEHSYPAKFVLQKESLLFKDSFFVSEYFPKKSSLKMVDWCWF